jgi:hypothetical protein
MRNFILPVVLFCISFLPSFNGSAQPTWQWAINDSVHGTGTRGSEGTTATADKNGNACVGGYSIGSSTFFGSITLPNPTVFEQAFITKIDSSGHYLWVQGSQSNYAMVVSVATDPAGNVYALMLYETDSLVFGGSLLLTQTNPLSEMYALVKLSPSGSVVWAKNIAPQAISVFLGPPDPVGNLGCDVSGNIYVTGGFLLPSITIGTTTLLKLGPPAPTTNLFVAKYDPSGSVVWAKSIACTGNITFGNMAVSPYGTVYVAGSFSDSLFSGSRVQFTSLGSPPFVVKIDYAGNTAWMQMNSQPQLTYEGVATDKYDRVYLAGTFNISSLVYGAATFTSPYATGYNVLFARLDSAGNVSWAHAGYDSSSEFQATAFTISADNCGAVVATGSMAYPAAVTQPTSSEFLLFGTDTLRVPAGSYDPMFIVTYDSAGGYIASTALATGGDDAGGACADNLGNLFIANDFETTVQIGSTIFGNSDPYYEALFVARYHYSAGICPGVAAVTAIAEIPADAIFLYPNPTSGIISVRGADAGCIRVYDLMGRLITQAFNTDRLSIAGHPAGMYLVRVFDAQGSLVTQQKVVKE